MYKEITGFEQPSPGAKLWRYMDFMKFIDLLDRKELFFARGDKLDDAFEGSLPRVNSPARSHLFPHDAPEERIEEVRQAILNIFKSSRSSISVNCWHENEYESAAMWQLYAKDNGGIAVRTTFKSFSESFIGNEEVSGGKVKYIDYDSTTSSDNEEDLPLGNVLHPFLYKRPYFEYEQEVRATVMSTLQLVLGEDTSLNFVGSGTYVRVDVDKLIEEVVLSPYAASWHHELVCSVAQKYGLKAPIRRSSVRDKPTWDLHQ